jgi:beta-ureidopropionase / N-carbamoyl-L-amino-acid hydrolase
MMPPAQNLQINPQRLWDTIMETAQFGATQKGGICRLTLTDLDRKVRDWFKARCEAFGCTVSVDEVGNMFARRPGRNNALAPIAMGSHLDTQPTGGKFDGVLGVLGALEALRTLHETGYETNAPIEIVNWTNEEGSRFAPAMLASGVFAGVFTPDYAYSRVDRDGKKFGEELDRIGYRGPEKAGARTFSAMFELHIEQGPILEDEQKMIGIVQGVQGMRWYEVTVTGQEAHTGATPMRLRKNALVGAARMIERIEAIALEHAPEAVGAVGLLENKPNSRNVVPGEVFFTIDFRHPDDKVLDVMEQKLRASLADILPAANLTYEEKRIWDSPAVEFAPELIACVRAGTDKAGFKSRDMISGAGHDAAYIARVAPTTMIFVPCAGGISHNEAESTSFDECAAGAQVLLNAVLEFDRRLG